MVWNTVQDDIPVEMDLWVIDPRTGEQKRLLPEPKDRQFDSLRTALWFRCAQYGNQPMGHIQTLDGKIIQTLFAGRPGYLATS